MSGVPESFSSLQRLGNETAATAANVAKTEAETEAIKLEPELKRLQMEASRAGTKNLGAEYPNIREKLSLMESEKERNRASAASLYADLPWKEALGGFGKFASRLINPLNKELGSKMPFGDQVDAVVDFVRGPKGGLGHALTSGAPLSDMVGDHAKKIWKQLKLNLGQVTDGNVGGRASAKAAERGFESMGVSP
jgi:hypothetical protein